jgi:hypothetical protein
VDLAGVPAVAGQVDLAEIDPVALVAVITSIDLFFNPSCVL